MNIKRTILSILALCISWTSVHATDFRLLQLLNFSTYYDIDTNGSIVPEYQALVTQPLYWSGFYYLDARLQNLWDESWMLRTTAKGKAIFSIDQYDADLRLLYVENRKPLGGHWLFSIGRMQSPYMLPVQRLDGASIGFSFDEEGSFIIGLIGGIIPPEPVGYRDYYYPKYRAGAFIEFTNKQHDMLKLQYNAGFEENNPEIIHQAMLQGYKSFDIAGMRSYVRTGILFTYPQVAFDYAFAEAGMTITPGFTHSISYIKNEVVYYLSPSQYFVEDFQEAYYRIYSNDPKSDWKFNISGGYSYSMGNHGYVAQANLFKENAFFQHGVWNTEVNARNRGVYHQINARTGYQFVRLVPFMDFGLYAGYEYFLYRNFGTNGLVYGANAQVDIPGNFTLNLDLDFRSILNGNTEVYGNVSFFHFLGVRFLEERKETPPPGEPVETPQE